MMQDFTTKEEPDLPRPEIETPSRVANKLTIRDIEAIAQDTKATQLLGMTRQPPSRAPSYTQKIAAQEQLASALQQEIKIKLPR